MNRRNLLIATSAAFASLLASGCGGENGAATAPAADSLPLPLGFSGYGELIADQFGLLDLPQGFSYRVLSSVGDVMSDGGRVPDNADGMGCFALLGERLALVRNHELSPGADNGGAVGAAYDRSPSGIILPGGTTTIVLNSRTLAIESQYRSLSGCIRNCSGGITPWGSWLSCEEDTTLVGARATRDHGFVFEVPATATGPVDPEPLTAMGRFNHEAAVVDPVTGYVYMTEDRADGLFYRFIPNQIGRLVAGGRLQALVVDDRTDSRNWSSTDIVVGQILNVRWVDLPDPSSPNDDLRGRGLAMGAMRFARGEGLYVGSGELFFTCTSGGGARLGQVFRLLLTQQGEQLQLFFESTSPTQLHYGDNLTVAPDGHLIVCEDQGTTPVDNYVRGILRNGRSYPLARIRTQSETAGACFSPDRRTLFLNIYSPAKTVAINGPWAHLAA